MGVSSCNSLASALQDEFSGFYFYSSRRKKSGLSTLNIRPKTGKYSWSEDESNVEMLTLLTWYPKTEKIGIFIVIGPSKERVYIYYRFLTVLIGLFTLMLQLITASLR